MVIAICVIDMIILTVGCCLVTKTAVAMNAVLLLLSVSCQWANAEVAVLAVQDSTEIGGLL